MVWNLEEKRTLLKKGVRRLAQQWVAHRYEHLSTTSAEKTSLSAGEPDHANRDSGRLRLYGNQLLRMDARGRLQETYVEQLTGIESMVVGIK